MKQRFEVMDAQNMSDVLVGAEIVSIIDLGAAFIVRGSKSVIGDFIALSTTDGKCAVIYI